MSERPTPETDVFIAAQNHSPTTHQLRNFARILERERDEARAIAHDLAVIASHCLGWHDHETGEATERISSVLKRWKETK